MLRCGWAPLLDVELKISRAYKDGQESRYEMVAGALDTVPTSSLLKKDFNGKGSIEREGEGITDSCSRPWDRKDALFGVSDLITQHARRSHEACNALPGRYWESDYTLTIHAAFWSLAILVDFKGCIKAKDFYSISVLQELEKDSRVIQSSKTIY